MKKYNWDIYMVMVAVFSAIGFLTTIYLSGLGICTIIDFLSGGF